MLSPGIEVFATDLMPAGSVLVGMKRQGGEGRGQGRNQMEGKGGNVRTDANK